VREKMKKAKRGRISDTEPMRNGGLDQGSGMDDDRENGILSGFDQMIEHSVAYSPGTTEEPLHQ
jgi:hypothetical protein